MTRTNARKKKDENDETDTKRRAGGAFQRGPPLTCSWGNRARPRIGRSGPARPDRPNDRTAQTERTDRPHRPDFFDNFDAFGTLRARFPTDFGPIFGRPSPTIEASTRGRIWEDLCSGPCRRRRQKADRPKKATCLDLMTLTMDLLCFPFSRRQTRAPKSDTERRFWPRFPEAEKVEKNT